jgi:DNA-directed RNA polymerase
MRLQLVRAYREKLRRDSEPPKGGWDFLAKNIRAAAEELLPKAVAVMDHIRDIAQQCTNKGRVMVWTSPSGFPCANRYVEYNVKTAVLTRRDKEGYLVRVARHKVRLGPTGKILKEAPRKAAANFIHAFDAAHLIFLVLMIAAPGRLHKTTGDVVTVHDCFACHASDADNLKDAIGLTLFMMYSPDASVPKFGLPSASTHSDRSYLAALRRANAVPDDLLPIPAMGDLDVRDVLKPGYKWH